MRAIGHMSFGGPEVFRPVDIPLRELVIALDLPAGPRGEAYAEVRGGAGPSERNIAVHTIVANSVAATPGVSNRLAPLPN